MRQKTFRFKNQPPSKMLSEVFCGLLANQLIEPAPGHPKKSCNLRSASPTGRDGRLACAGIAQLRTNTYEKRWEQCDPTNNAESRRKGGAAERR